MQNRQRFLLPNLEYIDLPLLTELGVVSSRTAGNLEWHRNNGFELTFAVSGEFIWEVKSKTRIDKLRLLGGDIGLTQPRIIHRGYDSLIGPGELLYIVFNPDLDNAESGTGMTFQELSAFSQEWTNIDKGVASIDPRTRSYCLDLISLLKKPVADYQWQFRKHELRMLILQILIGSLSCFQNPVRLEVESPIQKACLYMEENIQNITRIEQIVAYSGLGKTRFYEQFMIEKGLSPGEYLNHLRCRMACTMLRDTDKSITDIAFECSYSSSQYFSTCIRKFTGYSPSEYRQKQTN